MFRKIKKRRTLHKPIFDYWFGGHTLHVELYYNAAVLKDCFMMIENTQTNSQYRISYHEDFYALCVSNALKGDYPAIETTVYLYLAVNNLLFSTPESQNRFLSLVKELVSESLQKGAENAEKTTDEEVTAAESLVEDSIAYSTMDKETRKKRKEEMKEELDNLIYETKED